MYYSIFNDFIEYLYIIVYLYLIFKLNISNSQQSGRYLNLIAKSGMPL